MISGAALQSSKGDGADGDGNTGDTLLDTAGGSSDDRRGPLGVGDRGLGRVVSAGVAVLALTRAVLALARGRLGALLSDAVGGVDDRDSLLGKVC